MQIAVKLHYFSPTMLFSSFHYDLFALEICRIHYFFCKLFFSFFLKRVGVKGTCFSSLWLIFRFHFWLHSFPNSWRTTFHHFMSIKHYPSSSAKIWEESDRLKHPENSHTHHTLGKGVRGEIHSGDTSENPTSDGLPKKWPLINGERSIGSSSPCMDWQLGNFPCCFPNFSATSLTHSRFDRTETEFRN